MFYLHLSRPQEILKWIGIFAIVYICGKILKFIVKQFKNNKE